MADASALLSGTDVYQVIADSLGVTLGAALVIMTLLSIWALVWKGFALWKASQKKSIPWFIVLLIINTVGILEILYIFVFSKMKLKGKAKKKK